jgi:hypothetical protein
MEIIKEQDKPLSLLEKARQELAEFKRKQLSLPETTSTSSTRITTPNPSHGERTLHCSKVQGATAVLVLKLHEKGAEITDVIMRHNGPAAMPSGSAGKCESSDLRALLLSKYQGCPHCNNEAIVLCKACGCLSCLAGEADHMTCPVCGDNRRVRATGINLAFAQQKPETSSQMLLPKGAEQLSLPRKE